MRQQRQSQASRQLQIEKQVFLGLKVRFLSLLQLQKNMFQFLQSAAAPVALFALGVTVALRPFERVPWEVPGVILVKLILHPLIVAGLLLLLGPLGQPPRLSPPTRRTARW